MDLSLPLFVSIRAASLYGVVASIFLRLPLLFLDPLSAGVAGSSLAPASLFVCSSEDLCFFLPYSAVFLSFGAALVAKSGKENKTSFCDNYDSKNPYAI